MFAFTVRIGQEEINLSKTPQELACGVLLSKFFQCEAQSSILTIPRSKASSLF
jgi:hypothetical protein